MIGRLPVTLEIEGKDYKIRTDYRIVLTIFEAFNDVELTETDKMRIMLELLYEETPDNIEEALKQATWFLDGGKQYEEFNKTKKVMDWEQDESIIFSAVNKVAGYETREKEYIHWWTFLGYFSEIGEGLFSTIINIRQKKNKGKKLEKYEQEFYKNNKQLIDLKERYTVEEQEEIDRLNNLLNGRK